MKKFVLILLVLASVNMYAEKVKIYTSAGELSMELEVDKPKQEERKVEVRSTDQNQKISKIAPAKEPESVPNSNEDILLYNLLKKLNKLNADYISVLDKEEQEEAAALAADIRFLIEALYPDKAEMFKKTPMSQRKKIVKAQPVVTPPPPPPPPPPVTVNESDFRFMVERVEKESFDKDKISTLKMVMKPTDKITLEQCITMLKIFPFDDGRYQALEYLYPKILEKKNTHILVDYFDFISTKDKVKKLLMESR